jgi:archaellum biogenesis protein FlaJ (TadC family)
MDMQDNITQILQDLASIKTQLNDIVRLKDDVEELKEKTIVLEIKNAEQQREIDDLKENKKYYSRTAISAVIAAVISTIFSVLMSIL